LLLVLGAAVCLWLIAPGSASAASSCGGAGYRNGAPEFPLPDETTCNNDAGNGAKVVGGTAAGIAAGLGYTAYRRGAADVARQGGQGPLAVAPTVTDPKLRNIVGNLYKSENNSTRVGSGTTADAIRYELATGEKTAGRRHVIKGRESVRALRSWLRRNPNAAPADRSAAQDMLTDLQQALGGN